MNVIEFLNKLNNPLDNNKLLESVLLSYYKDNNTYSELTRVNATGDNKIVGRYYPNERDNYNIYLFNIWKKNVLNKDINSIKPEYRNAVLNIQRELKSFNPTTTKEINRFMWNSDNIFDKKTEEFLDKYAYTSEGSCSGWIHVSDKYLSFFKRKKQKLNIDYI